MEFSNYLPILVIYFAGERYIRKTLYPNPIYVISGFVTFGLRYTRIIFQNHLVLFFLRPGISDLVL